MMRKVLLLALLGCCIAGSVDAQDPADYFQVYPVGERPSFRVMTPMVSEETILFEANPIVRYALYNDIYEKLGNAKDRATAVFLSYRPQLRMYTDASKPVKMPSYRVALAGQMVFRRSVDDLFTVSLESGHYSNGQSGCTFLEGAGDRDPACVAAYAALDAESDLSDLLNRRSGEFSTNFTEVLLNLRLNRLVDVSPKIVDSFTLGILLFHDRFWGLFDFGGYAPEDIDIYGRWRVRGAYEHEWPLTKKWQASVLARGEYILAADDRVTPYRVAVEGTLFPWPNFGFLLGLSAGHDNYNIRLVDAGVQGQLGLTWRAFPPFDVH